MTSTSARPIYLDTMTRVSVSVDVDLAILKETRVKLCSLSLWEFHFLNYVSNQIFLKKAKNFKVEISEDTKFLSEKPGLGERGL